MPEDDVKHIAVLNGLAFVAMLADIQQIAAKVEGFNLRIGIDTGPVVAGVIGRRKFIYNL